jgi:outer membrane beta-barrel protein
MKRPAICLIVAVAIVGWTAIGHAKKGGGKGGAGEAASGQGEETKAAEAGADDQKAAADPKAGAGSESLDTTDDAAVAKVEDDISGPKPGAARPTSQLTWSDIVVVPRKAFLKGGRLELGPFYGQSVNDNLIRHHVFGVDLNYFLTDVIWVGLQGQYFIKQLTTQDELIGVQYNRTPTLNKYLYGGALNFGYVPLYGKFALFNRSIVHWEIWASAGIGATITEVIPRNPANAALAFKNTDLTPNVGIGSRFFILDWLTVNFALRDYMLPDKFEPNPNNPTINPTAADAKANADSAFVHNLMLYAGVGMYLPTKFTYKTPG